MAELYVDPVTGWRLPVRDAIVTQGYGPENTDPSVRHLYIKGYHTGIDISGVPEGAPIISPAEATVTLAGPNAGFGLCIILDRGDGTSILFGHLSRIAVNVGERVAFGQEIGGVGNTGVSTGVHLHYEYRQNGVDTNPVPFLVGGIPHGIRAIVKEDLNLRQGPDKNSPVIAVMPTGAPVTVGRNGWIPVVWEGREGWAYGDYIEFNTRDT